MKPNNLRSACKWFEGKFPTATVDGAISGRHGPICYRYIVGDTFYYVMFKREFLYSFARLFKQPGADWGQTVNMKVFDDALKHDKAVFIAVMPDSSCQIQVEVFKNYLDKYSTIRTPSTENSPEGSCPAIMWSTV